MKTLIVEDDFSCRLILQKMLTSYGECHIATNGAEAVRACRLALDAKEPYDLVCLDIMMPEVDGFTALKEIRALEEGRGILHGDGSKIVMATALGDQKSVFTAFRGLCDGYLVKPIDLNKLLELLRELKLIPKG